MRELNLKKFSGGGPPREGARLGEAGQRWPGDTSPGPPPSPENWQARAGKPFLIRRATGAPGGTRTPLPRRSGHRGPLESARAGPLREEVRSRGGSRDQGGWALTGSPSPAPENWGTRAGGQCNDTQGTVWRCLPTHLTGTRQGPGAQPGQGRKPETGPQPARPAGGSRVRAP